MVELKPAYLVWGDDEVRVEAWRTRLRSRASSEGQSGALEVLRDDHLTPEAVAEACGALTLSLGRRYVLADGVERWSDRDVAPVRAALGSLPAETVVVLIASGNAPAGLAEAVEHAGGEVHACAAPKPAAYPRWLERRAAELGLTLGSDAAEALLERVGKNQQRLMRELEKLAAYCGHEAAVGVDAVEALAASASETRAYELADAVIDGDRARALRLTEDLRARGEDIMHVLFSLLRSLRNSHRAWAMTASGKSVKDVQSALRLPSFIAKRIVAQARRADGDRLERALGALADLDYAVRGAGHLDTDSALTLAVTRATEPIN